MHVWVGNVQCAKRQLIDPHDGTVDSTTPSELGATVPSAK